MTTLELHQSLWAMEDLPDRWNAASLDRQVALVADAGYTGMVVDLGARRAPQAAALAPLLAEARLTGGVLIFARTDDDIDRALRYADRIGADWIICCARIFGLDPRPLAHTITDWYERCGRAGIDMQLETHRDTVTNDLRFTVALLELLDSRIEVAADLSHYVCAHEIPEQPSPEYDEPISRVLARAGSLQGRIATRAQIQVPLDHPMSAPWTERFEGWWREGFASIRRRHPQRPIRFVTELGTTPYAIVDRDGVQVSDRWAESLTLMDMARKAFASSTEIEAAVR